MSNTRLMAARRKKRDVRLEMRFIAKTRRQRDTATR
jgi:hypothetical protein